MVFKRILCATDFSEAAYQAFQVAAELSHRGGQLDVCNVMDRARMLAEIGEAPGGDRIVEELVAQGESQIEEWRINVSRCVPSAEAHSFTVGPPWKAIVDAAADFGSDLVVLGASNKKVELLGSTAERVVRHASCSVLVVPGGARMPHRILCGVDFSAGSETAVRLAAQLAMESDASLTLAHVVNDGTVRSAWDILRPETAGELRALADAKIKALAARTVAGRPVGAQVLESGSPQQGLLRACEDGGFDWLVVGSHGRGELGHVVLGSVTEKLIRRSTRPVLVAREGP